MQPMTDLLLLLLLALLHEFRAQRFSCSSALSPSNISVSENFVKITLSSPQIINQYVVNTVSPIDYPFPPSPLSWKLFGSLDQHNWTVLDHRRSENFVLHFLGSRLYNITYPGKYQYYDACIGKENGDAMFPKVKDFVLCGDERTQHNRQEIDDTSVGNGADTHRRLAADPTVTASIDAGDPTEAHEISKESSGTPPAVCIPVHVASYAIYDYYVEIELYEPTIVDSYILTTRPNPLRRPISWVVQGALDRFVWTTTDVRTDQRFNALKIDRVAYTMMNPGRYMYYRISSQNAKSYDELPVLSIRLCLAQTDEDMFDSKRGLRQQLATSAQQLVHELPTSADAGAATTGLPDINGGTADQGILPMRMLSEEEAEAEAEADAVTKVGGIETKAKMPNDVSAVSQYATSLSKEAKEDSKAVKEVVWPGHHFTGPSYYSVFYSARFSGGYPPAHHRPGEPIPLPIQVGGSPPGGTSRSTSVSYELSYIMCYSTWVYSTTYTAPTQYSYYLSTMNSYPQRSSPLHYSNGYNSGPYSRTYSNHYPYNGGSSGVAVGIPDTVSGGGVGVGIDIDIGVSTDDDIGIDISVEIDTDADEAREPMESDGSEQDANDEQQQHQSEAVQSIDSKNSENGGPSSRVRKPRPTSPPHEGHIHRPNSAPTHVHQTHAPHHHHHRHHHRHHHHHSTAYHSHQKTESQPMKTGIYSKQQGSQPLSQPLRPSHTHSSWSSRVNSAPFPAPSHLHSHSSANVPSTYHSSTVHFMSSLSAQVHRGLRTAAGGDHSQQQHHYSSHHSHPQLPSHPHSYSAANGGMGGTEGGGGDGSGSKGEGHSQTHSAYYSFHQNSKSLPLHASKTSLHYTSEDFRHGHGHGHGHQGHGEQYRSTPPSRHHSSIPLSTVSMSVPHSRTVVPPPPPVSQPPPHLGKVSLQFYSRHMRFSFSSPPLA